VQTISLSDKVNALIKLPDAKLSPQPEALQLIPEYGETLQCNPSKRFGNTLEIAMEDTAKYLSPWKLIRSTQSETNQNRSGK